MRHLLLLTFLTASAASAQSTFTVDGAFSEPQYRLLATDAGGPGEGSGGTRGFGDFNQLNAIYAHVDRDESRLYLGIAGILERNDNANNRNYTIVFLDTKAGGYNNMDFGRANAPDGAAVQNLNNAHTFDAGFFADYALQIRCSTTECTANLYTLSGQATTGTGGGPNLFLGNNADADVEIVLPTADPNSRTQGAEISLSFNATGAGVDLMIDRSAIQAFTLITGGSGYQSNQFLSPTNATNDPGPTDANGNYAFNVIDYGTKRADPVSLVYQYPADVARYRLLSPPVSGYTVGELATMNLVQGVAEQYPNAGDNVYLGYTGSSYVAATSTANSIPSGSGFFWQLYDRDIDSGTVPASNGPGTSDSYELSAFALEAGGTPLRATTTYTPPQNTVDRFYMIGNPFQYPLLVEGVMRTAGGGTLVTTLQAFNSANGSYQPLLAGTTTYLAPWQGVFAEIATTDGTNPTPITGAPTFSFNYGSTSPTATAPFYGRPATTPFVQLRLAGTTAAGAGVTDEAAYVRLLPDALVGWDPNDASKLLPPAGPYALVAPVGERDGAPYRTAVNSLPDDGMARTVPVAFLATDAGSYSLTWAGADALPAGWEAELHDLVGGPVVDLRTATSYAFTSGPTDWTDRFALVLRPAGATAGETDAPTSGLRVLAPRPNPASGSTEVLVELGEAQTVRAVLVDALGRRVLDVYDAPAPAGTLALRLDVAGLAPGVYVLRVTGARAAEARTVTVAR